MAPPTKYPHTARIEMCMYIPASANIVLDVGCNTGGFAEALKAERNHITVWGLEPAEDAAEIAKTRVDHLVMDTFTANAPIPDYFFDAITFNDVLEHIVDPWEALRLAATKLKKGGCVVASIPNVRQFDNLLHILFEQDFRYEALGIRDKTHLRFFTKKSIVRLLEDSGFFVERIQGINEDWWTPSLVRRVFFKLFGSLIDDTKYTQFAVVARPR